MENDEIIVEVQKRKKTKKRTIKAPEKKASGKKSKKTLAILKALFIIALAIGAIVLIMYSGLFNVKDFEVSGNSRLSSTKIISLSNIQVDTNIFSINKKQAKQAILENAYVEEVSINRKLPSTVSIEIKERIPTYILQFTDSYVYINNQGYMLEISNDKIEVPIIVGFITDLSNIKAGNRLDVKDLEKMNTILKIYETAKNVELAEYITKIDVSDTKEYKVYMESLNKIVYLGDASDLNSKMLELKEILHKTQNRKGEVFLNVDLNTQKAYFRQSID